MFHNTKYMQDYFKQMRDKTHPVHRGFCCVCEADTLILQTFSEPGSTHKSVCPDCGAVDVMTRVTVETR